jgi:hypothetical protein
MRKLIAAALAVPLMAATAAPALGPYGHGQYDRDNRGEHRQFYDGARRGGQGGDYYGNDRRYQEYDRRYHGDGGYYHQGGIGPGKGALIGGAGGAVLGALFGGGAKGAIIGGAAGAGIGAVVGEAHQNRERRDRYGNPY